MGKFLLFFFIQIALVANAQNALDNFSLWAEGVEIPAGGRGNPYGLELNDLQKSIVRGKTHSQIYPVASTGLLPPLRPIENFLADNDPNPFKNLITEIFQASTEMHSLNEIFSWVGLHDYPLDSDDGIYSVPYPESSAGVKGSRPDYKMGYGTITRKGVQGFTMGCATCHSANLFGKTVLGMTNRFPRANDTLIRAKHALPLINAAMFQKYNHATNQETALLIEDRTNVRSIGAKLPLTLGLDTSLAQVALSLDHREPDAWASKNLYYELNPRSDILDDHPGDSKPAVWWNVKYKNRWLSDGSIISGNPVFTNILWNEIGRGEDLHTLDQWLTENSQIIKDLASAIFSMESPRITDFFPTEMIDLESAKRGQKIFSASCTKCHGNYLKNWDLPNVFKLSATELLKTNQVLYKTKVVDVGTDSLRRKQMKSLEKLNSLEISQKYHTVIQPQEGYVPPPLVGIWARWPYFHNNSVPSLCAVLSKQSDRPATYYAGEANSPTADFDFACNGYPAAEKVPEKWRTSEYLYDTSREGMSNSGHDSHMESLSSENKKDLIRFLQTL